MIFNITLIIIFILIIFQIMFYLVWVKININTQLQEIQKMLYHLNNIIGIHVVILFKQTILMI